ncbi:MAG: Ppx/GppA phosphatase family protein [Ignavibacteriaceae bacterium]
MQNRYLAAIDVGTNSFHIIIVKVLENGSFKIIDREREVIRLGAAGIRPLGKSKNSLSHISNDEIFKAIKILFGFKKIAYFYGAEIRAVATSAVREAKNRKEFIDKIFNETGIKIEVIDGRDEAKLIYIGASKAMSLQNKKALCIDIGGGSTEFVLADKGKIIFAESVKVGTVRLSKKFFHNFVLTEQSVNECTAFVEEQILSNMKIKSKEKFELAVGSSGTIQSIAAMVNYWKKGKDVKSLNNFSFSAGELKEIASEIMKRKTSAERLLIKGIEQKRADIIPAGIIILTKIFEIFNLKEITVSEYALREGIILDSISSSSYNL